MFPKVDETILLSNTKNSKGGTRSFLFDFEKGEFVVVDGKPLECDGFEALKIWIEKILHTEIERFEVYVGTEYGCRLEDLIVGSNYPIEFIESELKREVEEALLKNEKITSISNFKLERSATALTISLEVVTLDERADTISVTF